MYGKSIIDWEESYSRAPCLAFVWTASVGIMGVTQQSFKKWSCVNMSIVTCFRSTFTDWTLCEAFVKEIESSVHKLIKIIFCVNLRFPRFEHFDWLAHFFKPISMLKTNAV